MRVHFLIIFFIFSVTITNGDDDKVDPKLELQDSKESNYSDKSSVVDRNTNTKSSSPKIQGVRVTIDTTNVKKSKEVDSNESIEVIDGKNKNTKKIGIHTDITFEITDDHNNATNLDSDDNDASVPIIIRGRDRSTTKKPKTPYDPRTQQWASNQPPIDASRFYPRYNPRIPVYTRTRDDDIYRSIDSWSNFYPITGMWTTEKTYHPAISRSHFNLGDFNSYQTHQYEIPHEQIQNVQWKPCYCIPLASHGWKNKRHSEHNPKIKIENKLENPFSGHEEK